MKKVVKLIKLMPLLKNEVAEGLETIAKEFKRDLGDLVVKRIGGETFKRGVTEEELATLKEGEMSIIHYVSTRDMDRDKEIIMPEGVMLNEFIKSPIVIENHDYSKPPIGRDEWIKADDFGIKAKSIYAPTERGKEYYALRKGGFLNTASIGAVPLDWVTPSDTRWGELVKSLGSRWEEFTKSTKGLSRIITKCLLLEHSDVAIPANINALTLAVSKGLNLSDDMIKSLGLEDDLEEEDEPQKPVVKLISIPSVQPKLVARLVKAPAPVEQVIKKSAQHALDMLTGKV